MKGNQLNTVTIAIFLARKYCEIFLDTYRKWVSPQE